MKTIHSYEQWEEVVTQNERVLLFVKTNNCSVCEGLLPQVEPLQTEYPLPFYIVNAAEVPAMAGQLSLFSAPVVLLFDNGKEYARFARFVPMEELKHRLDQLVGRGE